MKHSELKYIPVLLLSVLLLCSCTGGKVDPDFITISDFGLRVKDQKVFTYDAMTCQVAFNREKREFRVHKDNMSDYYCLNLRSVPTAEDQKVKGDIVWTSSNSIESRKDLTFVVKKVDRSGRLWLWCRKERIGAVIQVLD